MNNVIEFPQAKKIDLFDCHGNKIDGHKAVVNQENERQVFGIVTEAYTIVQHDEVVDKIESAVDRLGLKYQKKIVDLGDWARIKVEIMFPEIQINLGNGDVSHFRATFDNSYDSSTGLRLDIGAYRLVCTNGLYIGEKWGAYYHRHTQNIDINMLEQSVQHGVEVFQTRVKGMFEQMANTPITPDQARAFLDDSIEKKLIANKYLEGMKSRLDSGGDIEIKKDSQIDSQWMLYNLVSEELTHNCTSVEAQRRYSQIMNRHLITSFNQHASM